MNISGTQMHWLTLVFIAIETCLLVVQLFHFLNRPRDRQRLWYLILLALLIKFNIANGLFPDASLRINLKLQMMIAYGFAYLTGAYIPYYFYKAYNLRSLRLYATWGVLCFTLLPYVVFDVVLYAINGRLLPDREWGVVVPGIYGLVLLTVMFKAIVRKYRETGKKWQYHCELTVWIAILPWEVMSLFAFFPAPQWLRILLANLGWLAITLLQFGKAIRLYRREHETIRKLNFEDIDPVVLEENSRNSGMSRRETEIILLLRERLSTGQIARRLFLSDWTVKTHVRNILKKAGVNNRGELIRKLGTPNKP